MKAIVYTRGELVGVVEMAGPWVVWRRPRFAKLPWLFPRTSIHRTWKAARMHAELEGYKEVTR